MTSNNPHTTHDRITGFDRFNVGLTRDIKNKHTTRKPHYVQRVTTIQGLAEHITAGFAWTPAQFTGARKNENFTRARLVALDLDDTNITDVLSNQLIQKYAVIVHVSASGTGCRVVMALDTEITDGKQYKAILKALHVMFAELEPDTACTDQCRQFYGSTLATGSGLHVNPCAYVLPVQLIKDTADTITAITGAPTVATTPTPGARFIADTSTQSVATFDQLKREITQALGATGRDFSNYDYVACPMTEHEHDHTTPRAQWHEQNGVLHCFKCGTFNTLQVAQAVGIKLTPVVVGAERQTVQLSGHTVTYEPNTLMRAHRHNEVNLLQVFELLHDQRHTATTTGAPISDVIQALQSVGIIKAHRTYLQWLRAGHGLYWQYDGYNGTVKLHAQSAVYDAIYTRDMTSDDTHRFDTGHTATIAELTRHNRHGTTARITAPVTNEHTEYTTIAIAGFLSAYNGVKISQSKLRAIFGISSNATLHEHLNRAINRQWITKRRAKLATPVIDQHRIVTRSANTYTGFFARVGTYDPVNVLHIDRFYFENEHSALFARKPAHGYEVYQNTEHGIDVYNRVFSPLSTLDCTDNLVKSSLSYQHTEHTTVSDNQAIAILTKARLHSRLHETKPHNRLIELSPDYVTGMTYVKTDTATTPTPGARFIADTSTQRKFDHTDQLAANDQRHPVQPVIMTSKTRPPVHTVTTSNTQLSVTTTGAITYTTDDGQNWHIIGNTHRYSYDQLKTLCCDLYKPVYRLSQKLSRAHAQTQRIVQLPDQLAVNQVERAQ